MTGRTNVEFPLSNKYTFAEVFSKEENVRPLLEAVLGVPIGKIRYAEPEHVVESSLRARGVRMDVFAEDGSGTVYDVEMQNESRGRIELRSRYLLSSFDRVRIVRGVPYENLRPTVVIFVCGFDPIGLGRRLYVVRPTVEGTDRAFDDGTMRVFLNAHGAAADPLPELEDRRLAALLTYLDGGGTMGDEWVERLDNDVRRLNADEGWRSGMYGIDLDWQYDVRQAEQLGVEVTTLKSARQLMEKLGYSAQEALEFLEVPEGERPRYLEELESSR